MQTKSKNTSNTLIKWGLGLLALFVPFRLLAKSQKMAKPKNSIRLKLSEYRNLIPYLEAQARHESANYNSDLVKRANNLFGMKIAYQRKFSRSGTTGEYSKYKNYDQSIEDQILWLSAKSFPRAVNGSEQFVRQLKIRNYFGAPESEYLAAINFFLRN